MTELEKQIILAEAIGWVQEQVPIGDGHRTKWTLPNGTWRYHEPRFTTDSNDCNTLIKHLNGLGWLVIIEHLLDRQSVEVRNEEIVHKWCYETPTNWMHGVCELALKVLK